MPRLRCTEKLLRAMGGAHLRQAGEDAAREQPEDWYANLVWLGGRKCVLFTHVGTLFPIVVFDTPASRLRDLPAILRDSYTTALDKLEVGRARVAGELLRMGHPPLARTCNRVVLATMNDYSVEIASRVKDSGGIACADATAMSLLTAASPLGALGGKTSIHAVLERFS
ncbi:MAG: hypothetical protein E4H03_01345 [Myxococcales bacterium]|jgi:hypothetical protein|nr:MAG: hypothetical protein E4H03_01345 [Myxococcales bacterium]